MDIQDHIYILLTLIYVCLIVQNWKMKSKKRFDCLSVLAHENYICKLKQKKEN